MNIKEFMQKLSQGFYDGRFSELYGNNTACQKKRYAEAACEFENIYGNRENIFVLSVPGRSEVGGNHTDHNNGKVIACAVNLDIIAVVSPSGTDTVHVKSKGFDMDVVNIGEKAPVESENGKSSSLIRGVLARLESLGYKIGGFDAYTMSDVLKGSGLSSSAAFEVMIANIVSVIFNSGKIDNVTMAKAAQYAECNYFGKPCGLMDQTACAVGGFIAIDFKSTENPCIEKLDFDFSKTGYSLCIVDTAGDHADLSGEYAAVRREMLSVANFLGHDSLRACSEDMMYEHIWEIRKTLGDRSVLRAIHYFGDNRRVDEEVGALKTGDFPRFLKLVTESGRSSYMYLQNIYLPANPQSQGLSLALALSERILKDGGAWRVHGGGFAGTIQAFVPDGKIGEFSAAMENTFGKGVCHRLMVRNAGAYYFSDSKSKGTPRN